MAAHRNPLLPSGRTAEEIVVDHAAGLVWVVNLGCIELHPHPVRSGNLEHPDELRIDLDPGPGVDWSDVRSVALEVKALLEEVGLHGWPKTSGSRGIHINVRIEPRWSFTEVRRAALALSRAVERRAPAIASSKWWKEERHGVFLDYNQNAKDRTTCSAYSVRPLPDARVSAPLHWSEVPDCEPADFTVLTMPARFTEIGDPHAGMDAASGSLDALLDLAAKDEAGGLGDAPWPPHFRKAEGEPSRVQPSKARAATARPFCPAARRRLRRTALPQSDPPPPTRRQSPSHLPQSDSPVDPQAPPPKARKARVPRQPLIVIANSPHKAAVEAGLDRWKQQHPEAAAHLAVDDILLDRMRGTSYIWYRIRLNLRHIPEDLRPPQATPDPDDDPTRAWRNPSPTPENS